jgi:membrane dipeptidase
VAQGKRWRRQTVAFQAYVNAQKNNARNEALTKLRHEIADSLGVKWYNRNEFRGLSEDQKETFRAYRNQIIALADKKADGNKIIPVAVNVEDFVDHIDYLVTKIGIDHVGISSDFDGGGGVDGWRYASETFNVTLELVKRGYTETEISKLWSDNLLRVLDEVEAVARQIQSAG